MRWMLEVRAQSCCVGEFRQDADVARLPRETHSKVSDNVVLAYLRNDLRQCVQGRYHGLAGLQTRIASPPKQYYVAQHAPILTVDLALSLSPSTVKKGIGRWLLVKSGF
jgi:hypothetical protein